MATIPSWFYDESKQVGVDYNDLAKVETYDSHHQRFRDYRKSCESIISSLSLCPEHTVIDMGAGTGAFALHAASYCKTIYAVDISQAMLECTRQKAEKAGITNIEFSQGGFLTYDHNAAAVDALVSVAVLHHLPDFWKQIGLLRAAEMIKSGGRLYLFDIVFPSDMYDYATRFNKWIQSVGQQVGAEFATEIEIHIRDEYSTYDWVLEGLIRRAGFRIDSITYTEMFRASYLCTKLT